jgi:hypothetical protein
MVISNDNPILPKEGGFHKAKQQHMSDVQPEVIRQIVHAIITTKQSNR